MPFIVEGKEVACLLDPTTHPSPGLSPGPGAVTVLYNGRPVWRTVVDVHACPVVKGVVPDVGGTVLVGAVKTMVGGSFVARKTDIVVEVPGGPNPILVGAVGASNQSSRTQSLVDDGSPEGAPVPPPFGMDEDELEEMGGAFDPTSDSFSWPDEEGTDWGGVLDQVQLGLDIAGMVPVIGEVADVVSGAISLGRGDWAGALLSLGSAIPILGNITGAGKIGRGAGKVAKTVDRADDAADAARAGSHGAPPSGSGGHVAGDGAPPHKPGLPHGHKVLKPDPGTPEGRRKLSEELYREAGYSNDGMSGHMDGIDFSKPVRVVEIPAGSKIQCAEFPSRGRGSYYGYPGADTSKQGIQSQRYDVDAQGNKVYEQRVVREYTTTQPVKVLESTAGDMPVNAQRGYGGPGGETQLFLPRESSSKLKPTQ